MEDELLVRLKKTGILNETAALDDVLDLTQENILERRLQTIVFRKGLSKTIHQARQLITHGHIAVGDRRVTVPSYIVTTQEEKQINYAPKSPLSNQAHPLRQFVAPAPASAPEAPPKETPDEGKQ
jgi:small subunit ribosomal protein S4